MLVHFNALNVFTQYNILGVQINPHSATKINNKDNTLYIVLQKFQTIIVYFLYICQVIMLLLLLQSHVLQLGNMESANVNVNTFTVLLY